MDKLLSALGDRDRLLILIWLLEDGPKRQVEIVTQLSAERKEAVNPGEVSALVKPLIAERLLVRARKRGPLQIRDRAQLVRLLQAAAALSLDVAQAGQEAVDDVSDRLRRAVLHELAEAEEGV
jgi:hypothetical protein